MLTPDGDTRACSSQAKALRVFVVREVQGGRGNLAFDYHIYATALGYANARMALMSHTAAASMMPRAATTRPTFQRHIVRYTPKVR
jgi:hypothetical protein